MCQLVILKKNLLVTLYNSIITVLPTLTLARSFIMVNTTKTQVKYYERKQKQKLLLLF